MFLPVLTCLKKTWSKILVYSMLIQKSIQMAQKINYKLITENVKKKNSVGNL